MNNFVDGFLRLAFIKRFSMHNTIRPQSVAEHSYNVAMLCMYIFDQDHGSHLEATELRNEILSKALLHDYPECGVGDICATVKHYTPEINAEVKKVEDLVMEEIFKTGLYPDYRVTIRDCKARYTGEVVALADLIERLIYLDQEKTMGNTIFEGQYSDTDKLLASDKYKSMVEHWPTARELITHYLERIKR